MTWTKIAEEISIDIQLLSGLVDRIGAADFDIALLHFVNEMSPVPILEVCGYLVPDRAVPEVAGWCGIRADTADRVDSYIGGLFRSDPVLFQLKDLTPSDANFAQSFFSENIENEDYKDHFFIKPNFKSEVAMVHREKHGWNISKFFLDENSISQETLIQIGQISALIYPFGKRHALNSDNTLSRKSRPRALDRLNTILEARFPQLSDRERQVCSLTILGNSAKVIGEQLQVSPNTVITYRQRAYDRLGVNSASSLIRELI